MNSSCQSYLWNTNCAVIGCCSTAQHDRLFRFPRQKKRYREWAEFSLNPELRNVTDKRAYMCYKHFSKNQFRDEEPLTLVYNASPSYHSVGVTGTQKRDNLSSDESDDSDVEENYRSLLHKIEHSYCVQDIKEIIKDDCGSQSPLLVDLSMDCDDVTTMDKPQVTGDKPFTMKDIAHSLKQLREEKRRTKAMKHLSVTQLMSVNIWPHENIKPFIQLTSDVAVQTSDPFQAKNIALETLKNLRQEYLTVMEPEIVNGECKENLSTLENENTISPTNFHPEDTQSLETFPSKILRLAETPVNSLNVLNNSSDVETHSFPIEIISALEAANFADPLLAQTQSLTTAIQQPSGALLAEYETMFEPKPEGNPVSFPELPPTTKTNKSNPKASPSRTVKLKTYERTRNKFKDNAFLTKIVSILSGSSSQNYLNKESLPTRNTGLNNCAEMLKINVEPREHPFLALASPLTHTNESVKPKESLSSEVVETEPLQNQQIDKNCHKIIDSNLKTFSHSSQPETIVRMRDELESNQEHKTVDSTMKTVSHSSKPETIVRMIDGVKISQEHKTVDSTVSHSSKPETIVRMIDGLENNQGQHNTKDLNETSVQKIIDSPPIRKLCCYPELQTFAINDKTKEQRKELKTVELTCDKKKTGITNDELKNPEEEQKLITQSYFQKIEASNFKRVCNNNKKVITKSDKPERPNISEKMYSILKQNTKMINVEMESPSKTPKVEANEKSPPVMFHIDPVIIPNRSRHSESITSLPTISQTASKEGDVTNSGETTTTQSPLSKVDSVNTHSQETKPSSAIKVIDLTIDDHLSPPNHFDKPPLVDPKIVDVLFADSLKRSLKLANGFQNSPEHLKISQSIVENVKHHDTLQPVVKSPVKIYPLQQKRKAINIQSQCSKKNLISIDVIKQHCSNLLKPKAISITNKGPQSYMFDQNIDLFDQLSCKERNSLDVRHTLPQDQSPSNAGSPTPHDVQHHTLPKNQSMFNKSNIFDVQSPAPHYVQSTLRQDHFSCKLSTVSPSLPSLSKDTSQLEVSNKPVRKQIDPSFITDFKEHFNSVKRKPGKYKQSIRPKTTPSEFKHCLEARLSLPFGIDQKAKENVLEVKQYNPQNIEVELKTTSDPPTNKKASLRSVKPSQNEFTNCVQYNKSLPSILFEKSPTKRLSNSSFSLRGFALKFPINNFPLSKPCEFTNEIQSVDECSTLDLRDNLTAPQTCEQNQSIEVKDDDVQIIDEHIPNKVQKLGTEDNQTKELQCLSRKRKTNRVCTKVQVVPAVIQQVLKSDNGTSFINYLTNIQPMVSLDRSVTTFEQAVIKHIESLENSENNKLSVNSGCVNRQVFLNYGEQNLKLIGVSSEDLMEMDSSNPWVIKLESGWIT